MVYLVSLLLKPTSTNKQVQDALNVAEDWIRFADSQWLVVTSKPARVLREALRPLVEPEGQVFVCAVDLDNHSGWMQKSFWEWVNKYRAKST